MSDLKKLITAVTDKYKTKPDELSKKLEELILLQDHIDQMRLHHWTKEKKIEEEYTNKLKENNKELKEELNKCEHEFTKYIPDPSGNNDSTYECLVCKKDVGSKYCRDK